MKDPLFVAEDFADWALREEDPFTLPEERTEAAPLLYREYSDQKIFSSETIKEEQNFYNQSENIARNSLSFHKAVRSSLFETAYNQSVTLAPQFHVEVSVPDKPAADHLIDELERRLCREIRTELGGYLNW